MGRYAAIDIGSNSSLLLIVERTHFGAVRVQVDTKLSTKLSSGATAGNLITREAIERQFGALDRFAELLTNYHATKVTVCGTQVFRVTRNGPDLAAEIARRYGWKVEIIDGNREAELSYKAAASGLSSIPHERIVFDVGGGSSEVIFGKGSQIEFARSFPMGAVKLAELCNLTGKVDAQKAEVARRQLGSTISATALEPVPRAQYAIAVGGTAVTFATLLLGRQVFDPVQVHGVRLDREWLAETVAKLSAMSTEERRTLLAFDPDRAEIIVAGGLILTYLIDLLQCEGLTVSNRGLRWGMLLDRFKELDLSEIKQGSGA